IGHGIGRDQFLVLEKRHMMWVDRDDNGQEDEKEVR
ncbi:hypothetical protein Tco_0935592, partial [Tanacetum coccineum]